MKLISAITIQGFRSIRSATLDTVEPFTAFAGLNNSGKSNVLRALNAFFNGETEHGRRLDVDEDFYRPDLKAKKRKRISIGVTFSLPPNFTFRHGLEEVRSLLQNGPFEIRKEWRRGEPQSRYFLNGVESDTDQRAKLDQFLQLINFRYIANRVLPLDVIRNEHQALRDVLIRRLGKKAGTPEKAFEAIRDTSEKMVGALVGRFQQICPEEGNVRLATLSPGAISPLPLATGSLTATTKSKIAPRAPVFRVS
jgi:predicted ATP-dependent endonuclease of OLD family